VKTVVIVVITGVLMLGAGASDCAAQVLTWNFTGRVNFVDPALAGGFTVGDLATFTLAFQTATPASGPTPTAATYPGAITSLSGQVGSYLITMVNSPSDNFILVLDNYTQGFFPLFDGFTFSAPVNGPAAGGFNPNLLQINFGDLTGSAVTSTALPTVPPNPGSFTPGFVNFGLFFPGSSGIGGDILTATAVTPAFQICPLYDQTKAVKSGATAPVKIELCAPDGTNLSSPSIIVTAVNLTEVSTNGTVTVASAGNANSNDNFRFDPALAAGGGYIFNLKTTGLDAGTYRLNFFATGDTVMHAVQFQVK